MRTFESDLIFDPEDLPALEVVDLDQHEVFDLRDKHAINPKKVSTRRKRTVDQIDTIVLHQTGVKFGVSKRKIKKYGYREALHQRFYDVACHVAALMNGDVLLVNHWLSYVLHGHSSNRFSIGIEIEGLYPGIEGNPKTISGKAEANELALVTIGAARKAVQIAVEECRKLGCPITKLAAHRQFHGSRISDPGQGIWREVGWWAMSELGLEVDYDFYAPNPKDPRKSGRKIPRVWDPRANADYFSRSK